VFGVGRYSILVGEIIHPGGGKGVFRFGKMWFSKKNRDFKWKYVDI